MSEININVDSEDVPNVIITVDENSAQAAKDAAAAAQDALEEIRNTDFSGKLDKGTYTGDAGLIDNRIKQLEDTQIFQNRFVGKSYAIWSGTGLTYDVYFTDYYINNVLYPGGYAERTLAASDPTNPRFDLIKADATGITIGVGTPSENPEIPSIDPTTELAISPVLVGAGATVPVGVAVEDVYKENAEWTTASNNGTVNFNATAVPFQGTKHVDCGAFSNNQYLRFTDNVTNQTPDFSILKFYVNLKAAFSNNTKIAVRFYNGTTLISSTVSINNGLYNFDRTSINTYQTIIIPLSDFTFTSSTFNRIEIVTVGSNGSGFRLDNIALSQGALNNYNAGTIPSLQDVTDVNARTTNPISIRSLDGQNGISIHSFALSFWKWVGGVSIYTNILTDYLTQTYEIQLPNKTGGGYQTMAMMSDVDLKLDASAYNDRFKGKFLTEAAMRAAHPMATVGDEAQVNEVGSETVKNFSWDDELVDWVQSGSGGSGATNTDALPEGSTNFYYTAARFIADLTYARVIAALGFTPSTAPNNAQKNSDITKAEIEAKLTGEITTHTHPASGGGGDMTTTTDQEVSGVKTFLSGKLGFRNVANTFTSFFTNANTAARTYTLQNKSGTLADTTDVAAKMDIPTGGIANYLPKFLTATTQGKSKLIEIGSFLGLDTVLNPTKSITLSSKADQSIGVESVTNVENGKSLTIEAAKALNYIPNTEFLETGTTFSGSNGLVDICTMINGNVYASIYNSGIYCSTDNGENFSLITGTDIYPITSASNLAGDVYAFRQSPNGTVWKRTGGTGGFASIGSHSFGSITRACQSPNGDIYFRNTANEVLYCPNGSTPVSGTSNLGTLGALDIATNSLGDVFFITANALWKRTGGVGSFVNQNLVGSYTFIGIVIKPNDDIILFSTTTSYLVDTGTSTLSVYQASIPYFQNGITALLNGAILALSNSNPMKLYKQSASSVGTPDLNGGILKLKSGTGKGTGASKVQIVTGQKTTSGTDMQVETVRAEFDENGRFILFSSEVYADNAAAVTAGLVVGTLYRDSSGNLKIVY
ncbi:hypothetical protein H8R23_04975 [Flavobacterium sp. F-380]|uniref:Tail fiber protein n=1 Tax=Flavobacterium kayseriense TaxID=2764714 RepID=A0ABR7J5C5_9FLAO|nr:hypothetical protein [Flavobacterium kayseriense]MBC5840750.1 hypothetical protein [Flavobacterium kayseriense]MBC5846580.1 hypothetical protein [Flavobacterium kayseriense]